MALSKYKLGELIQLEDGRNTNDSYNIKDVKGISIQKKFIETKADMQGVSLLPYILVKPDFFAYVTVTSRNGEKITLAHNTTNDTYIVSSSYLVFSVSKTNLLNSDYLFMYFNRPEFDRYARFNSWGSARETFDWDTLCDIDIELPDLPTQQKYVDIYNAMVANQQAYERGLDDLKLTCDAYIEDLRRRMLCEKIGKYLIECNERNDIGLTVDNVRGIATSKEFIDTIRISVTVLPQEHIQVKGQVRGLVQPHFFPLCLLCGHLRPLCLLFFKGRNRLLDCQDFPGNADKLLRVLKLLPVFLHKVCWKVCKIFLAKPAEKEIPCNNVIDIALVIMESTVQGKPHVFAFLVTNVMWCTT